MSQLADELKTSKESVDMLKEELQKSYLTCTSYEQQILRLNEQLSIETMELQSKCDFYEKKVSELTEQLNTMEEEMYDPEAYYCLERDRVGDVGLCDYVVSQWGKSTWRRAASDDLNKSEEGLLLEWKV